MRKLKVFGKRDWERLRTEVQMKLKNYNKILIFILATFISNSVFSAEMAAARQSEAKILLVELATMELIFHIDNSSFTSDLKILELKPSEKSLYKIGFIAPSKENQKTNPNLFNSDALKWQYDDRFGLANFNWSDAKKYCKDCFASKNGFKAIAIGFIPKLDVWTIDQDKKMVNVINGSK